jgi:ankyrin repeat protein
MCNAHLAAKLLIEHGANLNCFNTDGKTPLMWAALRNHRRVAGMLLAHGAQTELRYAGGGVAADFESLYGYRYAHCDTSETPHRPGDASRGDERSRARL